MKTEKECADLRSLSFPLKREKDNFSEVIPCGFTEEQAVAEASRCLECGCHDYYECKLVDYANMYDVRPERFAGEKSTIEYEDDHPFIVRDPNKCILCGLCVRVCDEVMGVGALGLVKRGFDTVVMPNMENLWQNPDVFPAVSVSAYVLQELSRKELPWPRKLR